MRPWLPRPSLNPGALLHCKKHNAAMLPIVAGWFISGVRPEPSVPSTVLPGKPLSTCRPAVARASFGRGNNSFKEQ
jgi:hypothetical protein